MSGVRVELDPKFFQKFKANLDREKDAMISEIGILVQGNVKGEISTQKLVNTGNLRQSIQLDIRSTGKGAMAIVGTNALYALPLELGVTKKFVPGRAMIESVKRWAELKLHVSPERSLGAAIAISAKLSGYTFNRKGQPIPVSNYKPLKAHKFFEKAFMASVSRVPEIIERFTRRASAMTQTDKS